MVVGDLKFFAAVQMRDKNFLETAAAVGHVGDSGVEDSRHAGELVDDLVDELVRDTAIIPDPAGVTLTDALLALINVEETQLDGNFIALNRKTAFDQAFGTDRRPIFEIEGPERDAAGLRIFQISGAIQYLEPTGQFEIVHHGVGDAGGQTRGIAGVGTEILQRRHRDRKTLAALADDVTHDSGDGRRFHRSNEQQTKYWQQNPRSHVVYAPRSRGRKVNSTSAKSLR